jgi:hypothetical protein
MHGLITFILTLSGGFAPAHESPVISKCLINRGAYCILDAGEEARNRSDSREDRISLIATNSPEQEVTITSTKECSRSVATSPVIAGYSPYSLRNGIGLITVIFSLGNRCFVTVSAPAKQEHDDSLLGLSLGLGLTVACEARPCSVEGRKLMEFVPEGIRDQWFGQ